MPVPDVDNPVTEGTLLMLAHIADCGVSEDITVAHLEASADLVQIHRKSA